MINKFKDAKIYLLVSKYTNKVYVGSTYKKLSSRLTEHVSDFKRHQKGCFNYLSSFEIIKSGDARIVLLEDFPCNNKEELFIRENYWINKYKNRCVNMRKAFMNRKEYQKLTEFCSYCQKNINKNNRSQHFKSKKHQESVKSSSNSNSSSTWGTVYSIEPDEEDCSICRRKRKNMKKMELLEDSLEEKEEKEEVSDDKEDEEESYN